MSRDKKKRILPGTRFVRWIGYDLGISPNQITLGRLFFFIPGWFTWVYMHELSAWTGLSWQLIGFAALTLVTVVIFFDIVDGALARETGQVSSGGEGPRSRRRQVHHLQHPDPLLAGPSRSGGSLSSSFSTSPSTFLRGVNVQGGQRVRKEEGPLPESLEVLFRHGCPSPVI